VILARTSGMSEARDVGEEVCHELMRRLTDHGAGPSRRH
jgi:hypothetical protein